MEIIGVDAYRENVTVLGSVRFCPRGSIGFACDKSRASDVVKHGNTRLLSLQTMTARVIRREEVCQMCRGSDALGVGAKPHYPFI